MALDGELQGRATIDVLPILAWSARPDGSADFFNRRWLEFTGLSRAEAAGWGWADAIHAGDRDALLETWSRILASSQAGELEARLRRNDGAYRWFLFRAEPEVNDCGEVVRWHGTSTDIEDRKRYEALLLAEKQILEMITRGTSLEEILDGVCRAIDAQSPEASSTILLMDPDGTKLWPAAGPRVAPEWTQRISPLSVSACSGSCGTAAYLRKTVITADVASDPLWEGYRDEALRNGLGASWSRPLLSRRDEVIGTFAMYYREPRTPGAADLDLIESAAHLAVIAIEGGRMEEALRRSEREARQIIDAIPQLICVLAADGSTVYVNRPVLEFTGLSMEEIQQGALAERAIHPDDQQRVSQHVRQEFGRGVAFQSEHRIRAKEGRYRWFLNFFNPLLDESGAILRWYVTGIDIDERKQAEERVRNENLALREEICRTLMDEEIVGSSNSLSEVLVHVQRVAPTESTVLILGETGTGKELIARAIHKRSRRAGRPFIRVNCAAIPQPLIASELFGHEKGAFTGALERRIGRFEAAEGGTIFLDEIGELPLETQVALLRVLQEREFERVGSSRAMTADVRVIAATNRDLQAAVDGGTFRQDLFYRLNVFPIHAPPLRDRRDDIPLLVEYFVERFSKKAGKRFSSVSRKTLDLFLQNDWPGNIRELQNVIERAVILCDGETFSVDPSWLKCDRPVLRTNGTQQQNGLARLSVHQERELIEAALAASAGRVAGPAGAATRLGVPRQTLESKIAALGIDKHRFKSRSN